MTDYGQLEEILNGIGSVAIAFSGGLDSSLLLKAASDTLGERCLAITVDAPYHLRNELADASYFAESFGIRHLILPLYPDTITGLMENPDDRCYRCKKAMIELCLATIPRSIQLCDGSTADDLASHRPGRRALLELGVRSPLAEAGLGKHDIRILSSKLDLPTWNKPAQSCLMTRFPHDFTVTAAALQRVELCENRIADLGFSMVRVRSTGNLARVEVEKSELKRNRSTEIESICREAGFSSVTVDPAGYRCGSMDQAISALKK